MKNSVVRTQPGKTYEHLPNDDNLPLAIGANFHDDPICRSTQRKSHNLLLDRKVEYAPHTEYIYNGGTSSVRSGRSGQYGASHSASAAGVDDDDEDIWDGWFREELSNEDKKEFVVRMLGYFEEKVPESPLEEERVRKVCIKFFVKDDSISIVEAKEDNSGIVQAPILSRRRVPKNATSTDELILLDDLRVGQSICIYGQTYHIVDMDKRSRRYFREVKGEEVPEGTSAPSCAYSSLKEKTIQSTRKMTADDMDTKRAAEQLLTGIYTKHSTEDIAIAQQFLKNKINEHLSFLALWDDRGNLSGDVHFCVIRLFLENFSIEIAEKHEENCGRMTGPILLSRQRVPRPGVDLMKSRYQQHTYGKLMKTDYLCPEDFKLDATYDIFGKPFYVYDADDYTREYMRNNFGVNLGAAVDITPFVQTDSTKVMFHVPPPNGFGSEKERRDNWLALVGKTARLDQDKARRETGRIMNFSAKLAKPLVKGDEEREFIITFYRETDELEINEKPRRNSGFMGGRFLSKGKHRKDLPNGTTVPFQPSDFAVGEVVVIFQRPFLLKEMDEATRRILEGSDNPTTDEKIKSIVVLLKQQINLRFTRANEAYLALASNGTLGFMQIREFLRSSSCDISDEEALLVVQNISPGTNGVISFDDFLAILNASAESMDEASMSARSVKNVNMTVKHTMMETAHTSEDRQRRRDLQILLQHKLIQRKGSTKEQFRLLGGHSANARMQRETFRRSLNEILHINMGKKDEDMMVSMLFDANEDENGEISFKHFQEFVDSTVPL